MAVTTRVINSLRCCIRPCVVAALWVTSGAVLVIAIHFLQYLYDEARHIRADIEQGVPTSPYEPTTSRADLLAVVSAYEWAAYGVCMISLLGIAFGFFLLFRRGRVN